MTDIELADTERDMDHFASILNEFAVSDKRLSYALGYVVGASNRLLREVKRTRTGNGLLQAKDSGGKTLGGLEGPVRASQLLDAPEVSPAGEKVGELGPAR